MDGEWIERGDLWKNKARSLQLRLRDRFRVAVDRHHRRPRFSDGYFSSTMQRWLQRFRSFRRDSLPSTSGFYRKRVGKDIDAEENSVITRMLQAVAVPVIGNACHVFMHGLNRVQIYGAEKLHQALLNRPAKQPLITVSNHVASMDDPLVIASLLPRSILLDAHRLRWTLCATDRCFRNPVTSAFFRSVKVLPLSRGDGIYQKGMDMAISKLNNGGWVHIFPEGSRSRDGGRTMGSAKRGVGRLVLDSDNIPLVVPFVHIGMQDIMPIGAKFPRIGKTVTVLIGDPIYFDDILTEEHQNEARGNLYDAVSSRIGNRLQQLKVQVERIVVEQSLQSQKYPWHCTERAEGILQQIDWESLGMESYITSEDSSSASMRNFHVEPTMNLTDPKEPNSPEWRFRIGFTYEGGIVSRIRGYMHPTDLMGFAARGLFVNCRLPEI
ncbi:Tafazzin like [Actinidia chinensis var. chinensis]|uniref:Tafazzin family protein n=1 Tax=Actinidia chinensis var. chinensis TaxID=1590841 RepID=A0A2R6Q6Y6_ACTCC|nr:Tafazzin like [Actinidia chinensis var. chinensis]